MQTDDRIARIARAMCRAARMDPDQPAFEVDAKAASPGERDEDGPPATWTLFLDQAERFVAQHRDVALAL